MKTRYFPKGKDVEFRVTCRSGCALLVTLTYESLFRPGVYYDGPNQTRIMEAIFNAVGARADLTPAELGAIADGIQGVVSITPDPPRDA